MANCSNNNGCSCGGGNGCTRVGALNTLNRAGCYSRYPYYTGPCPPKPCVDHCGNANGCGCNSCSSGNCGCNAYSSAGCDGCPCNSHASYCAGNHDSCNGCCGGSCGECGACNCCDGGNAFGYGNCDCLVNLCDTAWNCGCNHCSRDCNSQWNRGCSQSGHAIFSFNGPVNLSPGGCVEFAARNADANYFSTSYGSILFRRSGLYYVAIDVNIPQNTEVDTVMRLELDNQALNPPEIAVVTNDDGTTSSFSGHTVFHANAGSLLKLSSLREMVIHCAAPHPVFTLTIFRIR